MFFLKRNKLLLESINEYLSICDDNMDTFDKAIIHFLKNGNDTAFTTFLEDIRKIEGKADSKLHEIENALFKKSLLPESREDLMRLLEKYDDIVDCSVHILRYLQTRNIILPASITGEIATMVSISIQCYYKVRKAIVDLLGKRRAILDLTKSINQCESQCDDIQTRIITTIFSENIDKFDKIILTDLINIITKLTDHCEDSADLITLINVKRVF